MHDTATNQPIEPTGQQPAQDQQAPQAGISVQQTIQPQPAPQNQPQLVPPQQMIARFEDKTVHNEKFTQFAFELEEPHELNFLAGQYVSVKVTESGERRSYSICSSPAVQHGFETLVDVTPGGLGSQFLQNLKFGDRIELLAPMGRFTVVNGPAEQELIFVATGSGISALKSMILDQLQVKRDQRPITLYWGVRHVNELFWLEEFQDMVEALPNFKFHPVISKAAEKWPLCRGRVTDCLSIHGFPINAGFYLCGNAPMIKDVGALLLQQGVPQNQIHHEKFY